MGIKIPAPKHLRPMRQEGDQAPIVIVGNGPAGSHVLKELVRLGVSCPIVQFGMEERLPYDRVALSNLLQGTVTADSVNAAHAPLPNVQYEFGNGIVSIHRDSKSVVDQFGVSHPYSTLILATGSSPRVPSIPGTDLSGVFTFRDFEDVEKLRCRHFRSRHCVVLGGGLLGIEAARGMMRYGTRVTLINHAPFLMNRQLEPQVATRLEKQLAASGMELRLANTIKEIRGGDRIQDVVLRDGEILPCDTVVLSTGIKPNVEIARDAGISVGTGIRVDQQLRTSDNDIFAIGECAEYAGETYGLVAPGLEQAAVLAKVLSGSNQQYRGSVIASSLKISDLPVSSIGTVSEFGPAMIDCLIRHSDEHHDHVIALYRGQCVGAAGVGEWPEFPKICELVKSRQRLLPWQRRRFQDSGVVFATGGDHLPDNAIVCNCRSLSAGEIRKAFQPGMTTPQLCEAAGAAQVCGSCEPLVAQIASATPTTKPIAQVPLIAGLLALMFAALFWLLPGFPVQESVLASEIPKLWSDNVARQWTGYTLLSLVFLSMVVSLAKRGPASWAKKFSLARNAHLVLALLMATVLLIHTGLQNSSNLNFALLSVAIALIVLGGITSVLVAFEPQNPSIRLKTWKRRLATLHLYLAWPLPVLLGFHIVSVYYF